MTSVWLPVRGPFSLAASIAFLEGFTPARYRGTGDQVLRMAFPVDRSAESVGVAVQQEPDGAVVARIPERAPERLVAQLTRILSLDVDGSGFAAVQAADPVVGDLAARRAGLRPVCFASPYEAACWAVLSQRTSRAAAATVKERIAQRFGTRHVVDDVELWAFPAPARLVDVAGELPVPEVKQQRLRALAQATLDGRLDADRLRSQAADEALAAVRELPGMGPFAADLVVVRGAGAPDVFPRGEGRLHAGMAALYGLSGPSVDDLARLAGRWSPYRSWVSLLIRAESEVRGGVTPSGGRSVAAAS
jgi:DNA-3-methyladenine glycosylase II